MRFTPHLVLITLLIVPIPSLPQDCVETITATFKVQQYKVLENGTVIDRKNRLIWAQCSLGQEWQNDQCRGKPRLLTWNSAMQAADKWSFAGHADWRLPNVHELSSVTELRCQKPAINLTFFPNTPTLDFWTATEFVNDGARSWRIHFGFGENHTAKKSTSAAVRLVRSIK